MIKVARTVALVAAASVLIAVALGWPGLERAAKPDVTVVRAGPERPVPVEVAAVRHGPMQLKRTFSGALEAPSQFVVAPKIGGRIERLHVNLADTVKRGQVVAELDNDEFLQAVAQARANLEVARANVAGAQSALDVAGRELARMRTLRERGMVSEAMFDTARAKELDMRSRLRVAEALVNKAEAELRSAGIRLGYTRVKADWGDGSDRRIVAERYVHEGETVAANDQLVLIVELSPIVAVIFVTESDYARLKPGQAAVVTNDAFAKARFDGRIARIAPVFREATRQARVELTIANEERLLKPGMFVRATLVLDSVERATHVPEQALTVRDGETGVFVVGAEGTSVAWREVDVGIREDGHVQVSGDGLAGRVVVLGQQLLENGSAIALPATGGGALPGAPGEPR